MLESSRSGYAALAWLFADMMERRSRPIFGVRGEGVRCRKVESVESLLTSWGVGGSEIEVTELCERW